ncbi:MAG: response regulator [Elusimicrobia bacterium]|nr:response regulator [Elusimicrobiota bacterium]
MPRPLMAKLLIIDDDADLVQILTIALQSAGHTVSSAGDPASGLDTCRRVKPDMILLDYHMPGNTGAHLFETLRRNSATAHTPILFMSAIASGEQVLSEVAEPALSRFLPKPVQMAQLLHVIEEMLAAAKSQ